MTHAAISVHQSSPNAPCSLQLAPLDTIALERLISDDASAAIEHARGLATALVGSDRDGARLRVVAKALAAERTLQALLTGVLSDQVARGNIKGVRLATEALRGCVARLERLVDAHRRDSLGGHRPNVVLVNHADVIQMGAS